MDAADLAGLEHDNLIVAIGVAGGQIPGARIARADGVALIATGHPMRLFNQVIIDGAPARGAEGRRNLAFPRGSGRGTLRQGGAAWTATSSRSPSPTS